MKLKSKFYKSVVRPIMLYDSGCLMVDKKIKQKMSVTKMKMLQWISGVTKKNNG